MYRQKKKNFWDCYSFEREPEFVPYQRPILPQYAPAFQPTSIISPAQPMSYQSLPILQQPLTTSMPMQQLQMQPLQSSIQYMPQQPMPIMTSQPGIPQMNSYGARYY